MHTFCSIHLMTAKHRLISRPYERSIRSILGIHNETGESYQYIALHQQQFKALTYQVNMFLHLIGLDLFFTLPISIYYSL
jgi:hypothetical protein